MNNRLKIIIAIVISIIIVIAIFFVLFNFERTDEETGDLPTWRQFFSFDRGGSQQDEIDEQPENNLENKLYKIHNEPVAGFTILENGEENMKIRFIERATGHIYDFYPANGSKIRISNMTMRRNIYEALWTKKDSVIISTLNESTGNIETELVKILGDSEDATQAPNISIEVYPLPSNIKEVVKSGKAEGEIYYKVVSNGISAIMLSDQENTIRGTEVFRSSFRDWTVVIDGENSIILQTKPSGQVEGMVFSLNVNNGIMEKIVGNLPGLSFLPDNTGKYAIYSTANTISISGIYILNRQNNTVAQIDFTETLPEKCVWSQSTENYVYCAIPKNLPRGTYPDDWYMGITSFNDSLLRIDSETKGQTLMVDPLSEVGEELDMINLEEKGEIISFINKKDLSLWLLDLNKR